MKNKNGIIPSSKELVKLPKLTEVFSKYEIRGIHSWDRLATVGKNNLGYFLSNLRGSEKGHTNEIQKLQEKKNIFLEAMKEPSGNPSEYFIRLSKEFDHPTFRESEIGKRPGGWGGDLEPLTKESETRKSGSTTFNICGWCKHAGGGSCRYSYHISTTCDLLSTLKRPVVGEKLENYGDSKSIHQYRELPFNCPCLLKFLTTQQCEELIRGIEHNIEIEKIEREKVREAIRKVQEFETASTKNKPWLVCNRPSEYMNVGDPVMSYLPAFGNILIVEGNWVEAYGVFGYRHHDGCMSFQTLFPIHNNYSFSGGCGGNVGMSRPEMLLRTEFDYLYSIMSRPGFGHALTVVENGGAGSEDTVFVDVWLHSIDDDLKGFNLKNFTKSLIEPNFAKPPKDWTPLANEIRVKTVKDAEEVLCMLNADLFKTVKEIKSWANMQLRYVHPDRLQNISDEVKKYANMKTKAIYDARDLLIERLKTKSN